MTRRELTENEIKEYISSHFETLQAFLSKLNLKESLCALSFLKKLVEIEISKMN